MELNFGRKKIFFTVLYRSPAFNHTSAEFANFLSNVTNLYSKIKSENSYVPFFAGDFNAHSQLWWPDGNTTTEGTEIDNLFSYLGLSQVISEPTNFEPNKSHTCIDLVFTDQPNLILVHPQTPTVTHQITYCKTSFSLPPPPPYEREIWHYDRANSSTPEMYGYLSLDSTIKYKSIPKMAN